MSRKATWASILLVGLGLAVSALQERNFLAKSWSSFVSGSETDLRGDTSESALLNLVELSDLANTADAGRLNVRLQTRPPPDLTSREACLAAPVVKHIGHGHSGRGQLNVVSWNLRFFPFGSTDFSGEREGTDVPWVGCALAGLNAAVIALQEIVGTAEARLQLEKLVVELDGRTGGRYRLLLDECPAEAQHVGLLYDSRRLRLVDSRVLAELNPTGAACRARLRPGLLGRFQSLGAEQAQQFQVISVHLDSGVTRRDYRNRMRSLTALREILAVADVPSVVIGDFNTMGCKTCDPQITAIEEQDGLAAVSAWQALTPTNRCSSYYRGRASWLDHGLVSPALASDASISVLGPCRADHCGPLSKSSQTYLRRVSDHCPVRVNLTL